MTRMGPTCLWNDSAAESDLAYSLEHGAVGATCNPVIVLDVLKREMERWKPRILALAEEMPTATEGTIAWRLVEAISATRAAMLRPVFDAHHGRNGRLSIQTDPRFYRDTAALVEQAVRFSQLAPNMLVKLPATRAGIEAIEEVTARGVSINATVSFSVPQAIAVAEPGLPAYPGRLPPRSRQGSDVLRGRTAARLGRAGRSQAAPPAGHAAPAGPVQPQPGPPALGGTRPVPLPDPRRP
jgi:transaldolase